MKKKKRTKPETIDQMEALQRSGKLPSMIHEGGSHKKVLRHRRLDDGSSLGGLSPRISSPRRGNLGHTRMISASREVLGQHP